MAVESKLGEGRIFHFTIPKEVTEAAVYCEEES